MKRCILALAALLAAAAPVAAQYPSTFSSPGAGEQLRLGVLAYNRGRYAESLLLFEKALAFEPGAPLIRWWLGRAYYKAGFEATALRAWEPLILEPDAPPLVRSMVERLRASRALEPEREGAASYVEVARFEGVKGRSTSFLRPSALLPRRDGSVLVVAHGSNELVRIDPNGVMVARERGGLAGFDRPFGVAELPDGTLFVTEFAGDRVARLPEPGSTVLPATASALFGSKGRGEGQLLGPQYATCDAEGYLYVVDYGNARVVKFSPEGAFVLSIGAPRDGFPGFESPAGLAAAGGELFVADSAAGAIHRFDRSGNYLGTLAEGLHFPEGLAPWLGGKALLVADTDRVLSIDLATEAPTVVYVSPDRRAKLVGAVADWNGNILVCDFDASLVLVLSEVSLVAAGYSVEIERVDASAFPQVELELSVRDRGGSPVVGLSEPNFYLTERVVRTSTVDERGKPVLRREETLVPAAEASLVGKGSSSPGYRAIVLAERSPAMSADTAAARAAVAEILSTLAARAGTGTAEVGLALAGPSPSLVLPPGPDPDPATFVRAVARPEGGSGRFDLGLRLAATSLLPSGRRDAVIYLGGGNVDEASFRGTTLSELSALLSDNGIRFYAVIVGGAAPSASLRYLAERSGGAIYAASRPRGLDDLAADIASAPSGRYRFRFTSRADSGFGRSLLSVAAEAYLYKKSGRDELGYYAPLR